MNTSDDYSALTGPQQRVLDLLVRHWLVTQHVARGWLFPDHTLDAVRKFLARFAEEGWLVRHTLADQEPYFVLGCRALSAFGLRRPTKALGPQAVLEHYAVLLACARRRCGVITEDEFRSLFPELTEPGLSVKNFFIAGEAEPLHLGLFMVDHDKLSSRLVSKLHRRVARMLASDQPKFRQMVLNGEISIAVLTATQGKRANLEAALAKVPLRTVAVTVEVHDELDNFFTLKRR